jgi:iron(III) transport system substrate-binding protein
LLGLGCAASPFLYAPGADPGESSRKLLRADRYLVGWHGRLQKYPVKTTAPCEGTSYEVGGIALIKGARNSANARRYYDFLMSPAGQSAGARAESFQFPANKTFKMDPRIPSMDGVRLIKYDFEKYGKAAERKRLIDRWTREVESLPR